jgi:hypothetical protein
LEHAAFPEHLEHGVATEYQREYVQKRNVNQATLLRGCVATQVVAAWLLFCYQFPQCEAKREYVLAWKAYQSEQTQKSPHEAGVKKPTEVGWFFLHVGIIR